MHNIALLYRLYLFEITFETENCEHYDDDISRPIVFVLTQGFIIICYFPFIYSLLAIPGVFFCDLISTSR